MHALLSDRFLRRFAGSLKRLQTRPTSNVEEQYPAVEADAAPGPESVERGCLATGEDREKETPDEHDYPHSKEHSQENDNEPQKA